jgi:DNA repair exonuclease SbcCD ATPase subunit
MKKLVSELKKELDIRDLVIDYTELNEILELNEYVAELPIATGKRIILKELRFTGTKNNGDKIDYKQEFTSGINIIISDNLKGKSSVFKIIKFALTGRDSLKSDISSWIKTIMLGFSIAAKSYTIYIDKTSSRISSTLYSIAIDQVNIEYDDNVIFKSKTKSEYEVQIQDFFFNQLSYYPLSWTQKDSAKDSIELREAKASWSTYFKSIYLESKDTNSFYGNQGSKTFQILLGLKYTKTINKLMTKRDFTKNSLAKKDGGNNISLVEKKDLLNELKEIKVCLDAIRTNSDYVKFQSLKEIQNSLFMDIQASSMIFSSSNNRHYQLLAELDNSRSARDSLIKEKDGIEKEVAKLTRKINDLKEYLESGYFFSNLTIKMCPSCNHEIDMSPINEEHECNLCHKPVVSEIENKEQFSERLKQLAETKIILEIKINEIEDKISVFQKSIKGLEKEKLDIEKTIQNNDYAELSQKSEQISKQLNELNDKLKQSTERENELISQKAILNYRLSLHDVDSDDNLGKLNKKLEVLETSIDFFINKRFEESKPILMSLEDLMLNEIHAFGLPSITKIHIDKLFNIEYTQNGARIKFEDIAEGEQLRVKLAFYLSIIQLDIKKNYGKHSRLLMIDSPAKEEGDNKYLEGLRAVLTDIENRYADKLQILIGTAERNLSDIVRSQFVYEAGQYVF